MLRQPAGSSRWSADALVVNSVCSSTSRARGSVRAEAALLPSVAAGETAADVAVL